MTTAGMTAAGAVHAVSRRAVGWAVGRSLGPNSVTGISVALSVCAVAWFTAGTSVGDASGAFALCGCLLAARAASRLPSPRGKAWLPRGAVGGPVTADATRLARVCAVLSECILIAGLAAGGRRAIHGSIWPVILSVIIAVAVCETMRACCQAAPGNDLAPGYLGRLAAQPADSRILLIMIAAFGWGARALPLALAAWLLFAAACAVFAPPAGPLVRRTSRGAGDPRRVSAVLSPAPMPASGAVTVLPRRLPPRRPPSVSFLAGQPSPSQPLPAPPSVSRLPPARPPGTQPPATQPPATRPPVTRPPVSGLTSLAALLGQPPPESPAALPGAAGTRPPGVPAGAPPQPARGGAGRPAATAAPLAAAALLARRDDGPAARRAGQLVRGNLIPLPPALAGVAAVVVMAVLGLNGLPGALVLTPLMVMLLAALGSSHPHNGRLDWLVPPVLQAGQYVYLTMLGYAASVPAPVIFTVCVIVAAWYADLGRGPAPAAPPGAGGVVLVSGLGWEGRMLVAGLGAILGIATVAYLALALYLAVLICWRLAASRAAAERDRP